jgi:hypothetical protein
MHQLHAVDYLLSWLLDAVMWIMVLAHPDLI